LELNNNRKMAALLPGYLCNRGAILLLDGCCRKEERKTGAAAEEVSGTVGGPLVMPRNGNIGNREIFLNKLQSGLRSGLRMDLTEHPGPNDL
jgi:hypothetical protein